MVFYYQYTFVGLSPLYKLFFTRFGSWIYPRIQVSFVVIITVIIIIIIVIIIVIIINIIMPKQEFKLAIVFVYTQTWMFSLVVSLLVCQFMLETRQK